MAFQSHKQAIKLALVYWDQSQTINIKTKGVVPLELVELLRRIRVLNLILRQRLKMEQLIIQLVAEIHQ
jgi:hypothetical protein